MWHFHKWGKVKDGYQYCTICGKARAAPVRKCDHVWETIDTERVVMHIPGTWERIPKGINYHLRCKKCGDMKFLESIS